MIIASRFADIEDLDELIPMYRALEEEQTALRRLWPLADGLAEPIDAAFKTILEDQESLLVIGMIDDVPLGFAWGRAEDLLPQAEGTRVGVVRLIFTDQGARGVGVGHEMVTLLMESYRERGITLFDARVSPGHRLAKNFFEAHGFSARLIVMNHDPDR